jgi:hypothetical protein
MQSYLKENSIHGSTYSARYENEIALRQSRDSSLDTNPL